MMITLFFSSIYFAPKSFLKISYVGSVSNRFTFPLQDPKGKFSKKTWYPMLTYKSDWLTYITDWQSIMQMSKLMLWLVKGIFSDSYKIFIWHKSGNKNQKRLIPKFQLMPYLYIMHNYEWFSAPIDNCVK